MRLMSENAAKLSEKIKRDSNWNLVGTVDIMSGEMVECI